MPVLVDTNALVALADAGTEEHQAIRLYTGSVADVLLIPLTVLPEADYIIARRYGVRPELRMLRAVAVDPFRLETLTAADLARSIDLVEQYADSNIGLVDASIVAIAERLRITRILTLDHRHFRMFRPKHCAAFELVP